MTPQVHPDILNLISNGCPLCGHYIQVNTVANTSAAPFRTKCSYPCTFRMTRASFTSPPTALDKIWFIAFDGQIAKYEISLNFKKNISDICVRGQYSDHNIRIDRLLKFPINIEQISNIVKIHSTFE